MARNESQSRQESQDNPSPPLATEAQQEKKPENFAAGATSAPPPDPVKTPKMDSLEPETVTKAPERPKTVTKQGESSAVARSPKDKRLTRAQMEQVIKEGGTVLHHDSNVVGGARHISNIADLPSEIELAGDDPVKRKAAIDAIDSQIEQLEQLKKGIK